MHGSKDDGAYERWQERRRNARLVASCPTAMVKPAPLLRTEKDAPNSVSLRPSPGSALARAFS